MRCIVVSNLCVAVNFFSLASAFRIKSRFSFFTFPMLTASASSSMSSPFKAASNLMVALSIANFRLASSSSFALRSLGSAFAPNKFTRRHLSSTPRSEPRGSMSNPSFVFMSLDISKGLMRFDGGNSPRSTRRRSIRRSSSLHVWPVRGFGSLGHSRSTCPYSLQALHLVIAFLLRSSSLSFSKAFVSSSSPSSALGMCLRNWHPGASRPVAPQHHQTELSVQSLK
mmetsp:Transcript_25299/g.61219  ORF Transcript_25299/g.61219 Transcript_25299/m.61219 type:complete len:226 (+) Transcript_25299:80-757(+)